MSTEEEDRKRAKALAPLEPLHPTLRKELEAQNKAKAGHVSATGHDPGQQEAYPEHPAPQQSRGQHWKAAQREVTEDRRQGLNAVQQRSAESAQALRQREEQEHLQTRSHQFD